MITKIRDADDAFSALEENFELLVTLKRKPDFSREVTNTIGKMISLAKTQSIDKIRTGDTTPIEWLMGKNHKLIDGKKDS